MTTHDDGRPAAGAAAVLGVLRLRLATSCGSGGPPSCGAGSPSPCSRAPRRTPRRPRVPAERPRHGAVRQGRRVPAPRADPLPRPDPPRRPQDRRRVRPRPGRLDRRRCWPTWSSRRPPSVRFTAPPVFADDVERVLAFGAQVDSRPVRARPPHRRPERAAERRSRSPGTWRSTRPSPPPTPSTATRQPAPAPDPRPSPPSSPTSSRTNGSPPAMPAELKELAVRAARQVVHDARVPRPLLDQVPPLLRHPRRAAPCPSPRPGPHRRRRNAPAHPSTSPRWKPSCSPTTRTKPPSSSGRWSFAGIGWDTEGDVELARAAAARAREYAQHRAARIDSEPNDGNEIRTERGRS